MEPMAEAAAFMSTLTEVDADQLTACSGWRAHELVAHLAAGSAAIVQNVAAFNEGGSDNVPPTAGLEERELPYREMAFDALCVRLGESHEEMMAAIGVALSADPAAITPWAGRHMPIGAFVTHARSEYALHRWDLVGDDETGTELLAQPELTDHAVHALGEVLTGRGIAGGAEGAVRLSCEGRPDISAGVGGVVYAEPNGHEDAVAGDAAARLLLLWGRSPNRPGRLRAPGGLAQLVALKNLLAGY